MLESLFTLIGYVTTISLKPLFISLWANNLVFINSAVYVTIYMYISLKTFMLMSLLNYMNIPFNTMLIFFIKFIIAVSFLIFIRTGIPRYRYDYLTKLGWLKFLIYSLVLMLWILLFFYIF